jgi:hypothetical protein
MDRTFRHADGFKVVYTHYDSIAEHEAAVAIDNLKDARNRAEYERAITERRPGDWYGVPTLTELKRIMREGFPKGAADVDRLYDAMSGALPRAVDFRRQRVRSDQGDSLDIHAVNRGALDRAWETVKRRARAGTGLIRVVVDVGGNCSVAASALRWRGVAALTLCRIMAKAGYSVEIVAGCAWNNNIPAFGTKAWAITTTTIKPRYAHVDTATLASAVCLTGFLRYLGFASLTRQADDQGKAVSPYMGQLTALESVLPAQEKITQVVTPQLNDEHSAMEWLKQAVALLQSATLDKEKQAA